MVLEKGISELQSGKVLLFFHPMYSRDARSYIETKLTICSHELYQREIREAYQRYKVRRQPS